MTEIDRLRGIIWTHEDTIRDHKEQIAGRDATIQNLKAEREEAAKRILSLEDSCSEKCVELEAKNGEVERMSWEVDAGRSVRSAVVELSQLLKEFLLGMDGARAKNLFAPETFCRTNEFNKHQSNKHTSQPNRPEEQPQKPMCDN